MRIRLSGDARWQTRTDAERRQLVVMYCDLVGPTELSPVYDGFTGSFDKPDLREARATLEELGRDKYLERQEEL